MVDQHLCHSQLLTHSSGIAYGFENMHPDLARFQKLRNRKTFEGRTIVRYRPHDSPAPQHTVDALYRRNRSNPFLFTIQGSNGSTPLLLTGLEKWLVSSMDILLLIG